MNRPEAIKCQIAQIAERVTGGEGYSLSTLHEMRGALLDAFDVVDAEIIKREKVPNRGILSGLDKYLPPGGAA